MLSFIFHQIEGEGWKFRQKKRHKVKTQPIKEKKDWKFPSKRKEKKEIETRKRQKPSSSKNWNRQRIYLENEFF